MNSILVLKSLFNNICRNIEGALHYVTINKILLKLRRRLLLLLQITVCLVLYPPLEIWSSMHAKM